MAELHAFTKKSILFGLLGGLIITIFSGYNTAVLKQMDVVGNYLPILGVFFICFLSFAWNLIAGRMSPRMVLSHKELVVVLGMTLAVCWIPGTGLYQNLVPQLVYPDYSNSIKPTWQESKILDYLPSALFPHTGAVRTLDEKVHMAFIQGAGGIINPLKIPFGAWLMPFVIWLTFIGLFIGATVGLTLLVHRQWAHHEQLRYPLASVADALIRQTPPRRYGDIFSQRLFWWGLLPVLGLYALNYLADWFPGRLPSIPMEYVVDWTYLFPVLSQSGNFCLHWFWISYTIIGIAYFVPSDVGLSVGLTAVVGAVIGAQYYLIMGKPLGVPDMEVFRGGGYVAFALILAFTGRTYYGPVLLKALGLGKRLPQERQSVLAARVFLLAYAGMIVILRALGMDLLIAFLYVTFVLLMFLVLTRLICESGIPVLTPSWVPGDLMVKLLGPAAVGPGALVFVYFLGSILTTETKQSMMPFLATGIKVADDAKIPTARFLRAIHGAMLVALLVGFCATLWYAYSYGPPRGSTVELEKAVRHLFTLKDTGQLAASTATHGLAKLKLVRGDSGVNSFFLSGLVVVLIAYMLRFRFSKWPIHPLLFLLIGTWTAYCTWASFLLGWGIKTVVVKMGGGKAYNQLKPLFIGVIMGELLACGIMILTAFIYRLVTGEAPVSFNIIIG